ncbi:rod shape-determining protein MreD [Candidatus Omnitrophota bacterium]
MKQRVYLYILLFLSVFLQVSFAGRITWFPDLVMLVVIFAGIFRGTTEGVIMGFVAGFLRGCFSPETFLLDVFLFSLIGFVSSMMPRMFYRQNPAAQIILTIFMTLAVVGAHVLFLNAVSGNDIKVLFAIMNSRGTLITTVLASPILFAFFQKGLKLEEEELSSSSF